VAFLITPLFVRAYKIPIHRNLTNETFKAYNDLFGSDFSSSDITKAIQGSAGEDDKTRPLRHFYDPISKKGLFETWIASKDWAQDTDAQSRYGKNTGFNDKYFSNPDDYSWDRAVFEYVHGDKDRAIETLGHVLHLIQDSTVPAHVRNDDHLSKFGYGDISLYEEFTANQEIPDFELRLLDIPTFTNLDGYFDNTARFTNENFLSKDTIFKDYVKPIIDYEEKDNSNIKFGYKKTATGSHKLVRIFENKSLFSNSVERQFYLDSEGNIVLTDYWNTLSRQAVINGVGVINLFFKEVEKERQTLALKNKNKSWAEKQITKIIPTVFSITKGLYGSSLTNNDVNELLGEGQAGSVVLAVKKEEPEVIQQEEVTPKKEETPQVVIEPIIEEPIIDVVEEGGDGARAEGAREGDGDENSDGVGAFLYPVPAPGYGGGAPASRTSVGMSSDTTAPSAPIITSPSDFSSTFTNNTITFSGTAEDGSTISTDLSSMATTTDSVGNWTFDLSGFLQGTTTVQFFATDEAGNVSQATTTTLFVDSNAPDVTLTVDECQNSLSPSSCLIATTTMSVYWNTAASDLDYFLIDNNGAVSMTTATSTSISVSDNSQYTFAVSSVDTNGNSSATSTQTVTISTMPVVINEVAWAGTSATYYYDEWIELYNNTGSEIDLNNWALYAEDNTPYVPLSGTISAGGYYLLERTDDNTVSDINADLVYGNDGSSWALNNTSAERLMLAYNVDGATTTVDEITKCNNWCSNGSSSYYKTMERYDTNIAGTVWNNWGTALGEFILNGSNATSSPIYGTPKAKNSISYQIVNGTTLSADKTVTKANSPYLIGRNGVTVQNGVTLTIEPGVIIKFVSANTPSFTVNGTVVADGTNSEKIVFTSFSDDDYGGDMNGDGASTTPVVGSWKKIALNSSSQNSSFKNVIMRYGGKWFGGDASHTRAMFLIDNNDITFQNNIVEYSGGHGLSLSNSTSTISNNIFRYNTYSNSYAGLYGGGGASTISNNTFDSNNVGLDFSSENDTAIVSDNIFTNNSYRAVYASGNKAGYYSNNSGSNNGINGIVLSNSVTYVNTATSTLHKNALPYYVNSAGTKVHSNSTLAIDSGVVIKFNGKWMDVFGKLDVNGTIGEPVIFTSASDDSDGNDMLNDGAASGQVAVGNVVYLKSGSTSEIENTEFRFMETALSYNTSPIYLDGVIFTSNTLGVSADPSETIIKAENVTWTNNTATSTIPL